MRRCSWIARPACLLLLLLAGCAPGSPMALYFPEQRHFAIRDTGQMPPAPLPPVAAPLTVASPTPVSAPEELSLDLAIHIALSNSQVVRILTGVTATASGQTIYDAAISNTHIDVAKAVFDPVRHPLPGLAYYPALAALREPAYAAARRAAPRA